MFLISVSMSALACEDGDTAYESDNYEAAIPAYTECMAQSDSSQPDWNHRRGRSHMKMGDNDQALNDFNAAIEADNNHAASLNSRAWIHYLNGNASESLADINAALAIDPASPRYLDTYAHILAAAGETDAAIQAYDAGMHRQDQEGVAKIQRQLTNQGIDPGPIDGVYGPRTRAALEQCARKKCNIWKQ